MTTVEFTSTVLGDESLVATDISRMSVWAIAGEDITTGKVVRLKQSVSGAVVEIYDYVGTPDPDLPPYGIALTDALSGNSVLIAIEGMVSNSITGLATAATIDPVTVSSSGVPTRNASYASTDWVIGTVDEQGRLQLFDPFMGVVVQAFGNGSPEGVVAAGIGTIYHRLDGGAGTSLYIKESGTGNTGWVAITTSSDIGAADEVLQTNAGGDGREWGKIANANVATAAAIAVSKLASGTANHVVKTNAAGTAVESGLLADANIDAAAEIAVSKLADGAAYDVCQTNADGTTVAWAKITDSHIDAAAEIAISKLADGAADEVAKTDAAGTGVEWGKIADANIATNAAINITKLAGGTKHREIMSWDEDGDVWSLDPGANRSILEWRPATGVTPGTVTGGAFGSNGTISHPAPATTNFQTQTTRTQFRTGVAAGDFAGIVGSDATWIGTGGLGGFFFWARFSMATNTAATRCFIGLSAVGGGADCSADPSTAADTIGVGYDAADTNWQVIRVTSGAAVTKVDTGEAKSTDGVYELRMFCDPSGANVFVQLYDFGLGAFLINTSYSTGLPGAGVMMAPHANCGTAASGVAQDLQLYGLRVESFY